MNLPAVTINSELNTETILSFLDSCFNMDSTGDSGGGGENCLDPRQRYGRKPSNDPLRQLQESTQALWDRMAAIEQILYLNQASNSVNSMQNGIVEKHHEHIGREPKVHQHISNSHLIKSFVNWIFSADRNSPVTRSLPTMNRVAWSVASFLAIPLPEIAPSSLPSVSGTGRSVTRTAKRSFMLAVTSSSR